MDPALKSKKARTALAGRMCMGGLLMMAKQVRGHVHPFTVVKSITKQEGTTDEEIVSRLVLGQPLVERAPRRS